MIRILLLLLVAEYRHYLPAAEDVSITDIAVFLNVYHAAIGRARIIEDDVGNFV